LFMFGLAVVLPATTQLVRSAVQSDRIVNAEYALKVSLLSLLAFSAVTVLSGASILVYGWFSKNKRPIIG